MASEFTFDGIENHQSGFTEQSTGMKYWLPAPDPEDGNVQLLDGDEVIIPTRYSKDVWSIRERRVVRRE